MIKRVDVFYEGWGERWLWGSLVITTALNGRPAIFFEYSETALQKGYELSLHKMPLRGNRTVGEFPPHQMGLPGPVYDSLPDGWGMLLMDRLFRSKGIEISSISSLDRLTFIGDRAMGALTFMPVAEDANSVQPGIGIEQLAIEIEAVISGYGNEFLEHLAMTGGSPQGARPKALVYRCPETGMYSTANHQGWEAWLVKFPGANEAAEVCAIEYVYAQCLRDCGIETPDTQHFALNNGLAAFASRRFDRNGDIRIPMQSLASFTGADFRMAGSLSYETFLRATQLCTNDVREKIYAFERAVFNVAFNNRDDHPKNLSYIMSKNGDWTLAPAFDVTFCTGPGGYHQMDVKGEALSIDRKKMLLLGIEEAELTKHAAEEIIDETCIVARKFSLIANTVLPGAIAKETLKSIQRKINENVDLLS